MVTFLSSLGCMGGIATPYIPSVMCVFVCVCCVRGACMHGMYIQGVCVYAFRTHVSLKALD